MVKQSTKQRILERRRREARRRTITVVGIAVIAIFAIYRFVVALGERAPADPVELATSGPLGEAVPTAENVRHVPEGADPGPFSADPPTSGQHYATQLFADFYDEDALETYAPYPEGYLLHSSEHGYVIFWYNCSALATGNCEDLKRDIQDVMGAVGDFKVIGFPRPTLEVPVVITTWERSLSMPEFDPVQAEQFARTYRNQAPEPNAP
jgi:hypothetical protein